MMDPTTTLDIAKGKTKQQKDKEDEDEANGR